MELRGRSVLVTGATEELEQAVARRLRAEGCALTLSGRLGAPLDALAAELDGRALVADFTHSGDLERLVAAVGDVDVLVVGSAVAGGGELTGHSVEQIGRVLDANLRAPVLLARLFGERMLARGTGHLVFISSLSGKSAGAGAPLLAATLFGLRGFALALRQDWGPRGVGVSCVNPGPVGEPPQGSVARPAGFRPRTADDVAAAVVRAVRHDRAEVDVADPVMRAGVVFGQLAPQTAARLGRLAGSAADTP